MNIFENKTGKSNKEEFETKVNNILNQASKEAGNIGIDSLDKGNRFISLVTSGSKGNALNISQMISCLGQQNVDNQRIPYSFKNRTLPHFQQFDDTPKARGFVENSFIKGLEPTEVFFHAMGGRVGLSDTAVKTSQTGYIQRRLIKGLEDIQVKYDMTVRNHKNKIIQFKYGEIILMAKTENIKFPLMNMSVDSIYEYYSISNTNINILEFIYDKDTIRQYNDEIKERSKLTEMINIMIDYRNVLIKDVYKMDKNDEVYHSINFKYIIDNVKEQFKHNERSLTNLTPLDFYKLINECYEELVSYELLSTSSMFNALYYFYMNPINFIITINLIVFLLRYFLNKLNLNINSLLFNPEKWLV